MPIGYALMGIIMNTTPGIRNRHFAAEVLQRDGQDVDIESNDDSAKQHSYHCKRFSIDKLAHQLPIPREPNQRDQGQRY